MKFPNEQILGGYFSLKMETSWNVFGNLQIPNKKKVFSPVLSINDNIFIYVYISINI